MSSDLTPCRYAAIFRDLLKEDQATTRTDKIGRKVNVPNKGRFYQGKNGKGIGIAHDSRAVEDNTGQMVEVPPDAGFRQGDDGKGIAVSKGELVTMQPNGSLKIRRGTRKTPPPGSALEAVILSNELARRFGSES